MKTEAKMLFLQIFAKPNNNRKIQNIIFFAARKWQLKLVAKGPLIALETQTTRALHAPCAGTQTLREGVKVKSRH